MKPFRNIYSHKAGSFPTKGAANVSTLQNNTDDPKAVKLMELQK
jgi:hypothetical protein